MIDAVCPPPRLLLGTSLLFWGAMTGRPVVGLIAALLVEAKSWTKTRWDFNNSSYESAWQLSFVMIALAALVIWLDESRYTAVLVLLTWMPPLLLPLQFVQSYGMKDSIDLGSFSFLAKRSRERNKRLGLRVDPVHFNFGNVLFVVTLLASSVGMKELSYAFLPGLIVLCSWALISTGRCRWGSLVPVMIIAGGLSLAGQYGLENLERWIQQMSGKSGNEFNPHSNSTLIGTKGVVKLSPEIIWRLNKASGVKPPHLLRTATYMDFNGYSWRNQQREFQELDSRSIDDVTYYFIDDEEDQIESFKGLAAFTLRGGIQPKDPLPLPGQVSGIRGTNGDIIEKSSLGTVRILPRNPVIEMEVFWGGAIYAERPFDPNDPSGRTTPSELDVIAPLVQDIGLTKAVGLGNKLELLRSWFHNNFEYTQELTIQSPFGVAWVGSDQPTPLAQFLTDARAGHCEYFATAATLMLREAGVHSRYAIGYAVVEPGSEAGTYMIRGTHSHAWVRVWDEQAEKWIDFDPTPPDWFGSLQKTNTLMQRMRDALKRVREDFYLWRTQPENEWWVMAVVAIIGVGLGAVVIVRLWRSKKDIEAQQSGASFAGPVIRTPLHALERQARDLVGERPTGMPYGQWIMGLSPYLPDSSILEQAIVLHQRQRFDPEPSQDLPADHLDQLVGQMKTALKQQSTS